MKDSNRATIAYIAGRLISESKSSSIYDYGDFRAKEVEEDKKQALLQKEKFKLLLGGNQNE